MKKKLFLPVLLILVCLMFTACREEETYEQDPNILDSQEYVPETVYIGSALPLSGSEALRGERLFAAQQVAADIINESYELDWDVAKVGGISGYGAAQVQLISENTFQEQLSASGSPAAQAAKRLLDLGVVALVGGYASEDTADMARRARIGSTPLVAGCANLAELTDGQSHNFQGWLNRIAPTARQETAALLSYLKYLNLNEETTVGRLALVYSDTDYGRETLAAFDELSAGQDWEVVARVPFANDSINVASEVQRIVAAQPDAVLHVAEPGQLTLFMTTYATAQFQPVAALAYAGAAWDADFRFAARAAGVNCWGGLCPFPSLAAGETWSDPEQRLFDHINNRYRLKTGRDMDNNALYEFAAVITLAQAIGAAGSSDGEILAQTLRDTVFPAPYLAAGSIDFDENGQNITVGSDIALVVEGEIVKVFE